MPHFELEILGVSVRVSTDSAFIFDNLSKDFKLFLKDVPTPQIHLSVSVQPPPYERVPALDAGWYALGFICYKKKNTSYVVYSGEGSLFIYDFDQEKGELFGTDEIFLYEKARLAILSRTADLLEKKGFFRIHAFGISLKDKVVICMLPMEGGKTTSMLNLLRREPGIKVLADDICLVDQRGDIHPFLLRLGARDEKLVANIPSTYITQINRPYYGVKYFIDPEFFKDRLGQATQITHLLIGQRSFRQETTIKPISKFVCIGPMFESGVFGRGLPHLLEFFVRGGAGMMLGRIKTILARTFCCTGLVLRTNPSIIKIGRDKEASVTAILNFLKDQ